MSDKKTRYLKITTQNNWEYFARASGGSNRKWTARYYDMLNQLEVIKKINGVSKDFLDGYETCLDIFHRRDNILVGDKEKR